MALTQTLQFCLLASGGLSAFPACSHASVLPMSVVMALGSAWTHFLLPSVSNDGIVTAFVTY